MNWASIREKVYKIKHIAQERREFILVLVLVLVAFCAFALGRLSAQEEIRRPVHIVNAETFDGDIALHKSGMVAASRRGSKYHAPWCSGAKSIAEYNLIWFDSAEEARAAGYTPASNCKGLQ